MQNLAIGLATLAAFQAFWFGGAVAAWFCRMLTLSQMLARGITVGMPYLWHFGMWNDLWVVHPLLALWAGLCWEKWVRLWWLVIPIFLVCLFLSWKITEGFAKAAKQEGIVESHVAIGEDGRPTGEISAVGWVHVPQMALIFTGIIMIIITVLTTSVPRQLTAATTALLLAHVIMGRHLWLRIANPSWNPWPAIPYQQVQNLLWVGLMVMGIYMLYQAWPKVLPNFS